jgi:hypothetical protein
LLLCLSDATLFSAGGVLYRPAPANSIQQIAVLVNEKLRE